MPGVIEVSQESPISPVIDALLLLLTGSLPGAWEGQVLVVPFGSRSSCGCYGSG
jgi:hypothetical protein